jgi:hypothetical protein
MLGVPQDARTCSQVVLLHNLFVLDVSQQRHSELSIQQS